MTTYAPLPIRAGLVRKAAIKRLVNSLGMGYAPTCTALLESWARETLRNAAERARKNGRKLIKPQDL